MHGCASGKDTIQSNFERMEEEERNRETEKGRKIVARLYQYEIRLARIAFIGLFPFLGKVTINSRWLLFDA